MLSNRTFHHDVNRNRNKQTVAKIFSQTITVQHIKSDVSARRQERCSAKTVAVMSNTTFHNDDQSIQDHCHQNRLFILARKTSKIVFRLLLYRWKSQSNSCKKSFLEPSRFSTSNPTCHHTDEKDAARNCCCCVK